MTDQTITTDIATLPPADRALIVLNSPKTEAELRAIVAESQTVTEVKDKTDRDLSHSLGMRLKKARTTIEKTGKAARDDANAFAKAVVAEEKRLIAITEPEETRVLGLRDEFDRRIEAEKQAKAAREAEIKEKIAGIRNLPLVLAHAPADEIAAEKEALEGFTHPEDVFGEFTDDCKAALTEAIAALADLHEKAVAREQAAAALAAEQARLDEERRQLEAERAAYEAEKRAFEARKAEVETPQPDIAETPAPEAPALALTGSETEPAVQEEQPVPVVIEETVAALDAQEPVLTVSDWKIRRLAMATADQFHALALKVAICGFTEFSQELDSVADTLRSGTHDAALASADRAGIVATDTNLLDATVNAIDALTEETKEAA